MNTIFTSLSFLIIATLKCTPGCRAGTVVPNTKGDVLLTSLPNPPPVSSERKIDPRVALGQKERAEEVQRPPKRRTFRLAVATCSFLLLAFTVALLTSEKPITAEEPSKKAEDVEVKGAAEESAIRDLVEKGAKLVEKGAKLVERVKAKGAEVEKVKKLGEKFQEQRQEQFRQVEAMLREHPDQLEAVLQRLREHPEQLGVQLDPEQLQLLKRLSADQLKNHMDQLKDHMDWKDHQQGGSG